MYTKFRGIVKGVCLSTAGLLALTVSQAMANPLEGYTIHVSAPHMMDGEVVGPFHHYCKPINADIIQCILFESTDPNARMTEVEYMVSKRLARQVIPEWSHKQNWHDHEQEIATGRVAIHNPSDPKEQAELAAYVGKTDGIIFHLWPHGAPIPDGSVSIAQSVGHWEAMHGTGSSPSSAPKVASSEPADSSSVIDEILKRNGIIEMSGGH
ncbi:MAG: OBAP family protein [Candidatus Nitrohelix vancouverensis]|uniref:OBAP family protein n=1 Tax=Candidatus Nitrohelix vancouverensis TaxID=2705534 RepID=A0A7T0G252_9BACT|nr:MAG: OBAP family protein [Candidatus Nitrohelix vancouverensis]